MFTRVSFVDNFIKIEAFQSTQKSGELNAREKEKNREQNTVFQISTHGQISNFDTRLTALNRSRRDLSNQLDFNVVE